MRVLRGALIAALVAVAAPASASASVSSVFAGQTLSGDPARIGATGPSYGGGVSLQLATLKDRVMAADGSLQPWKSPGGVPLHLAAAAPVVPWSDLVYSLTPNGRTLDYQVTSPTADRSPIGVEKQAFNTGLFLLGKLTGFYSPPLANPQADLTTWYGAINAGEPCDGNPQDQAIEDQIDRYHSAYYLLDGAYGTARETSARARRKRSCRPQATRRSARRSTRSPAAVHARRSPPPTRAPASRRTACPRRPAAATPCSEQRP